MPPRKENERIRSNISLNLPRRLTGNRHRLIVLPRVLHRFGVQLRPRLGVRFLVLLDQVAGNPIQPFPGFFQLLFALGDDRFGLGDAAGLGRRVAFDADGLDLVGDGLLDGLAVEAHDHAGQVVGGEACQGVLDQRFGSGLWVEGVPDQVDRFLIRADVPELSDY